MVVHVDAIRRLQGKAKNGNGKHPPVFKAKVPEGNAIASSAEFVKRGTLRQKYAYQRARGRDRGDAQPQGQGLPGL